MTEEQYKGLWRFLQGTSEKTRQCFEEVGEIYYVKVKKLTEYNYAGKLALAIGLKGFGKTKVVRGKLN